MGDIETIAREAKELAERATPGPWRCDGRSRREGDGFRLLRPRVVAHGRGGRCVARHGAERTRRSDGPDLELIAHAGTHYGALADEVLRLREALRQGIEHRPNDGIVEVSYGIAAARCAALLGESYA